MSTYKVIQDIEAEDKLVGPLSLRQFIYAGIAGLCLYLSFLAVTKHAGFMVVLLLPIAAFTGFFAFPWGKDQPTEVWALAKVRFFLKPRKRIWDQSGTKELVTITVPKRVERHLTNGLDQVEVNSRLHALAHTIDSRGWAIKNVNVNMYAAQIGMTDESDRLVAPSSLPQEVTNVDIKPSDDILDEDANAVAHHFDDMIQASSQARRQQLMDQMQSPTLPQVPVSPPQPATSQSWFMPQQQSTQGMVTVSADTPYTQPIQNPIGIPQAANPTAEELAMVAKFKAENENQAPAYGHMKVVKTLEEQMADDARARIAEAQAQQERDTAQAKSAVTASNQAVIMNLARNDDLDVATLARQIHKNPPSNDGGEVVISLR